MKDSWFDVPRCRSNIVNTLEAAGASVVNAHDQVLFEQAGQNFILDIVPIGDTACISLVISNLADVSGNDEAAIDYIHSFFSRRYQLVKAFVTSDSLNASFQSLACDERYYTRAVHAHAIGALLNAKRDFLSSMETQ